MDLYLFLLLAGLICALVLMVAVMGYLGFRFIKMKEIENQIKMRTHFETGINASVQTPTKKEISQELIKSLKKTEEAQLTKHKCVDHADREAKGKCLISGDYFYEECLTIYKDMKFGKKYIELFLSSEWVEVVTIPNDDHQADVTERIQKMKMEFWKEKKLPLIVQGHYKINIQTDQIESFTVVMSRIKDKELFQKEFSFIN
jgi:hypothetical protein